MILRFHRSFPMMAMVTITFSETDKVYQESRKAIPSGREMPSFDLIS